MDEEVDYGRIALIPKGDFAGDVQYDVGDVVSYEGSSYIAKRKPPVATLPTDTEYWQISSQGSKYIYINLTAAEYNERLAAYRADPSYIDPDTGMPFSETLYNVTDDYDDLKRKAENITYTDTFMLGATDVQGIIDIIGGKVENLDNNFLTSSKSVYVDATNGDDTTGDGSQEKPWATIQKAVNECPLGGSNTYSYIINIANGVYGGVDVAGKKVTLANISSEPDITVRYVLAQANACININTPLTVNSEGYVQHGIFATVNSYIYTAKDMTVMGNGKNNGRTAVGAGQNSCVFINNFNLNVSNYFQGVCSTQGSYALISSITGNNLGYGLYADNAGIIKIGNAVSSYNTLEADNKMLESAGGRIIFSDSGWQLIGSVTGANSVAIDSELYTEFLVKIKIPNTIVEFEVHLCSTELTTTAKRPSYGCMFASNDYYGGSINATNTSIKLDYIWRNGVSITDTTTMTVYGKR